MPKRTVCRLAQSVHLAALGVWCGVVGGAGIAAAVIFPLVRDLDPTLGAYPVYTGDHASLAAGRLAGRIFFITDTVQFICGLLVLASLIAMLLTGYALRTPVRVVRSVLTLATLGLLSYHLTLMMPEMTGHLSAYWDAAARGLGDEAETHRRAFMSMHEPAANILRALTLSTLACLLLAGFTTLDARDEADAAPRA